MKAHQTEREFMQQVADLARLHGWRVAHFRPGRTADGGWRTACQFDAAGFPDLLLIRDDRLIVAEVKVGRGKLTPEQNEWLRAFGGCGATACVWRLEDWQEIVELLEG